MKILIASGTFPPEVSGQAWYVSNLIKRLNSETKVISYGGQNKVEGSVTFVARDKLRFFNYFKNLSRLSKQVDLIYAHDLFSSGLPSVLVSKIKSKKIAVRIGGDFLWEKMVNLGKCKVPLSSYYDKPKSLFEKFYLLIYKFVLSNCDLIIFNTDWQRQLYSKVFKLDLKKTAVIENPIDISLNTNQSENLEGDIIYAGRLIPLKNIDKLINVFKKIKTTKDLFIIGDGPQKKELEKLADDNEKIKFLGKLNQKELHEKISNCYMVVLPSLSELSPNLAYECLALKKPILLTKEVGFRPEVKEIFELIDPLSQDDIKDKIESLLKKENYQSYLDKIKSASFNRGWQEVTQEHQELFKKLF